MTRAEEDVIEHAALAIGAVIVNLNMDIAGIIEDGSPSADVPEILRDAAREAFQVFKRHPTYILLEKKDA